MKRVTDDYIEKLESVDKKIIIKDEGLKITDDALLLSKFIKKKLDKSNLKGDIRKSSETLLEIGSGQGIISLLLSEVETIEKIYAVEIQKKIFENLSNNIEINHLENKIIAVNKDIKNIEGKYSYIISNPPYRKINSGRLPEDESERISKYEITLTLEELFVQIRRLLKNCGEFFVIVPDERLNDCFSYIYKNNMNILEMEVNRYKKRNLIILHGKKGGKVNSRINIGIL